MKLVEITLDYPYHTGEAFCFQELEIAQDFFDEIVLVCLSGHVNKKNRRVLPPKVRLIHARKKRYEIKMVLKSLFQLFTIETIKEIYFARKKLKVKEGIKTIISSIFIYYYYYNLLVRVFKREKFDSGCIFYSYWMAAPAYFLSRLQTNSLTVTRTHRFDCFIGRNYQPFRRQILKNLDCIVSISEAGKKDILEKLGLFVKIKENKIVVSRLGIWRKNIEPDFYANESERLHIVSCSNINKIKRLDIIIDALEKLNFNIEWMHIGDGELGNEIKKYAKKLDAKKNIVYEFKGWMSQEEIYEYYNQNYIDLFINCSDSEGIPVSIMEIMSYGVPVIARDVGGNSEIVNEKNGYLLAENNISQELAYRIKEYKLLSIESKKRKRENAFFTYDNGYRAEKNYVEFFKNIKIRAEKKRIKKSYQ